MDKLEKFILENRAQFDSVQPSSGLWERLNPANSVKRKGKSVTMVILYRAAAVILIFTLSYMLHEYIDFRKSKEYIISWSVYNQFPELKEAEIYYNQKVSARMKEIKPFFESNTILAVNVNSELAELDSIYSSLLADLNDNIANELIIEAMIMNYRMRLNILESLLSELKAEVKNNNNVGKDGISL